MHREWWQAIFEGGVTGQIRKFELNITHANWEKYSRVNPFGRPVFLLTTTPQAGEKVTRLQA